MKKSKLILSLTSAITIAMPIITLTSCNSNTANIKFDCSEGVYLEGDLSTSVEKGTTWWELNKAGKVPKVDISYIQDPVDYGWYIIDSNGDYNKIENDHVINGNETFTYIAFNLDETHMNVNLTYSPDPTVEPWSYDCLKGVTFKRFREYYNIPATPQAEGYKFKCFMHGSEVINDAWTFPEKDSVNIKIVYDVNKYNVTFNAGEHGRVSVSSASVAYGTEWSEVKKLTTVQADTNYKFSKWVDANGNEISDDYIITDTFTAKALFVPIVYSVIRFGQSEKGISSEIHATINAENGLTWKQTKEKYTIVDPTINPGYTGLGWFAIDDNDNFEVITDDYVISKNILAYYAAYDNANAITVNLTYDPDKPTVHLYGTKGTSFKLFREVYGIPESITKPGKTFNGWYIDNGATKITDTWTFPTDKDSIDIQAKFDAVYYDITLTSNGFGTVTPGTIKAESGKTWGETKTQATVTPISDDYEFDRWVDTAGNTIPDKYIINGPFTAKAMFVEKKVTYAQIPNYRTKASFKTTSHGSYKALDYAETKPWTDPSKNYFAEPTLKDNQLIFDNTEVSFDLRFINEVIKITIPVKPHSTKTSKVNVNGLWHLQLAGMPFNVNFAHTFQIFELNSASDHPAFYSNQEKPEVAVDVDPKSRYCKCFRAEQRIITQLTIEEEFNYDALKFTDVNDTNETKYVDHYIGVSWLIEGVNNMKNPSSNSKLTINFNTTEI